MNRKYPCRICGVDSHRLHAAGCASPERSVFDRCQFGIADTGSSSISRRPVDEPGLELSCRAGAQDKCLAYTNIAVHNEPRWFTLDVTYRLISATVT